MIPAGFAQVTFVFSGTALPHGANCVIGVENTTSLSAAVVADRARQAFITSDLASEISNTISVTSVKAKLGPDATGPIAEVAASIAGLHTGLAAPPNCTALLRKNTASGGRMNRGRMYLPGLPEGQVDAAGTLDTTFRTNYQADATALLTALTAQSISMFLLHATIDPPTLVTSLIVESQAATQRRRLRG